MTILVTGGTGLVGSRLLRRFVDAGVDCRALVRPGKEVPTGATRVEGDLLDVDSLKPAVEGVAAIVHLAAVFRTPNQDAIWRRCLQPLRGLPHGLPQFRSFFRGHFPAQGFLEFHRHFFEQNGPALPQGKQSAKDDDEQ